MQCADTETAVFGCVQLGLRSTTIGISCRVKFGCRVALGGFRISGLKVLMLGICQVVVGLPLSSAWPRAFFECIPTCRICGLRLVHWIF